MAGFDLNGKRIWVAGDRGMVGSAVVRRLESESCEIVTAVRGRVDLRRQESVERFIADEKPDAIIVAAAKVGGILANDTRPAEFLYDNLMIEANIIHAAHQNDVNRLVFLGSSCIYPKFAPQPMTEDALLTGPLESTNEWYAIAKIAGIKLCQAYRKQYGRDYVSAMPTNLYGPNDNFDLQSSHVLPALMVKIHDAHASGAPTVPVWGTGTPRREFLHVDDCADGIVFLLKSYSGAEHLNLGTGVDVSIRELAESIARTVGYRGEFVFDTSKPDGTPRKLMNVDRMKALGWEARIPLDAGIRSTYQWFLENRRALRGVA